MINKLTENELFLANLDYFDTAFLRKIQEKNFFISRIKKAILRNNGSDIDCDRLLLHWNFMITNISKEILNASIITDIVSDGK